MRSSAFYTSFYTTFYTKVFAAVLIVIVSMAAGPAGAHPLAPSLLELEIGSLPESQTVGVLWRTPRRTPTGVELWPVFPPHCTALDSPAPIAPPPDAAGAFTLRWRIDCGERGLVGEKISVSGLAESRTSALIRVSFADGRRVRALLLGGDSPYRIPARESRLAVARSYARLGALHIAGGADHLLFVLGLVLLVRGRRRLVATITAFTAGHSVTLAASTLGWLRIPASLAELGIVVSLLAVGLELARTTTEPAHLLRRQPGAAAAAFGLLHGLGFASALREVGLPALDVPLALAAFNIGIEAGQLAFIAVILALAWAMARAGLGSPRWLRTAGAYTIGTLAAFWCIERAAAIL